MKPRTLRIPLIMVMATTFSGCFMPEIPIIGLDENGNPGQTFISEDEYTKRLGGYVTNVQDSSIPALEQQEVRKQWMLRTMVFGVGVNAEIGIGPWRVGATPMVRLMFTNNSEPTIP